MIMMSMSPIVRHGYGAGPSGSPGVSPGPGGGGHSHPMTPMTPMSMQQQQQIHHQQLMVPQSSADPVSLALLIEFIVQKTYNELTVMADLLPRKTDMERKQDIFGFSSRTRMLFTRLLALVKWASSAAKVDKCVHIMSFLEKQSLLFTDTADVLARIARETLVHARLPNFHIPAAVEVLTTGTYNRLPACIRERIVPPDPVTGIQKKQTLNKLNQVIQHRLVTSEIPIQMRDLKIEQGRVVFRVENEFEVSLTVLGDSPTIPWKIIEIEILVDDKEIGDGMSLVHSMQISFLQQLSQSRVETSASPLKELYYTLHSFAQSLQLEVLYTQALKLCRDRLGDYLIIEEYSVGQSLILRYWNELSTQDPKAELGYRINISVDPTDSAQLILTHQPPFPVEEAEQTVEGLRLNHLEKMLVRTVYLRSRSRLVELQKELELRLGLEPVLSGSPPVVNIPILSPCLVSEQVLVTVNIHTGSYIVHVPQFDPSPPIVKEIENVLNSSSLDSTEKLKSLLSQMRYWITERRCERTLQHLPASGFDGITLLKWEENPILSRIGPNRLTIKFQKHPYAILIVEFTEREDDCAILEYFFHLILVKKASADENEDISTLSGSAAPKFYLKPVNILPLDTFTATHGPFTSIDDMAYDNTYVGGKRKPEVAAFEVMQSSKKQKNPPNFVPELAHIVAMCDERLPFALLSNELSSRGVIHGGCVVEANGTCLSIPIYRFSLSILGVSEKQMRKLHLKLDSAFVRSQVQIKGFKTWNLELKFTAPVEDIPGMNSPIQYVFEMNLSSDDHIPKLVDTILDHWNGVAKLFVLLERSMWLSQLRQQSIVEIKTFTWNNFTLFYGPGRVARANFMYSLTDKCYKVYFGGLVSHNPHTLLRPQLQAYLNGDKDWTLENLVRVLHETYEPLCSLVKLPTTIQLGTVHHRPQLPVQTFVVIPQSTCHIRVVYNNIYCLDVHFQPDGLVSIRDGAYSLFDKTQVLGDLTPTQGLKAFLSKYVEDNAVFRRRSQSEDDNPPSPITTMLDTLDHNVGTPTGGPGSSSSFLSKPQSPAPGRSNPHTPASPHLQPTPTGFSPATSFANLASPPSLPHLSQPSPNPSSGNTLMPHHPAPSPSIPAPSPSGGPLSVPTPSPNPSSHTQPPAPGSAPTLMGGPSPFFGHCAEGSPAAVQSPWGIAGSPSMPRPSPIRAGYSPGMLEGRMNIANRVLPQRSWAGAIPTILTHEALDILCTPVNSVDNGNGDGDGNGIQSYACSPLERFLGCSNLRRQLQRIVQAEEHLNLLPSTELGVLLFRSETMQFRVGLDPNNFQSLHLKITGVPEIQFQWSPDEVQLLETFFATKVVCPPFRPNGLAAFARMISLPPRVIRDLIQIIRLQLIPSIGEQQGWKWLVQLCLTVPPSALPIIAPGMPAVVISQSKFLIYLLLTRVHMPSMGMETDSVDDSLEKQPFIVAPLVHDMGTNCTQLAEKRNGPVPHDCAVLSHHIKRFIDFTFPTMGMDCSLLPTVQDMLLNFVIPPEGQLQPTPPTMPMQGAMVRPPMQQMMSPVGHPQQQFGGIGPPMM